MQRQQQVEFKEEITSQMGCKWGLGTSWRPLGAVLEKSAKKHAQGNFSQSLLEAFLNKKAGDQRSDFFLELNLLLPLRLLLENAP